jgi:hypothetical protein
MLRKPERETATKTRFRHCFQIQDSPISNDSFSFLRNVAKSGAKTTIRLKTNNDGVDKR